VIVALVVVSVIIVLLLLADGCCCWPTTATGGLPTPTPHSVAGKVWELKSQIKCPTIEAARNMGIKKAMTIEQTAWLATSENVANFTSG
jgi:hypothetical protein